MKKINFSLIELMAVIVVILVLLMLSLSTIKGLRTKAKTIMCANQLKQLGTLIITYANDHGGYLPYSYNGGGWIPKAYHQPHSSSDDDPTKGRRSLYGSWSGHLIPYMKVSLKSWNMGNQGSKKQDTPYYNFATSSLSAKPSDIIDPIKRNWQLLNNMYFEGGHGSLKLFVCPEILNNPLPAYIDNGHEVPNFYGILNSYKRTYGLPSTYKANGQLFGNNRYKKNSQKYENVNKKNILLLEGGHTTGHPDNGSHHTFTAGSGANFARFFSFTNSKSFASNNLNNGQRNSKGYFKTGPNNHTLYMHDDSNELWISDWGGSRQFTKIYRFNKVNAPYAAASGSYLKLGTVGATSIASSIYPGKHYGQFKTKAILNLSFKLNERRHYYKKDIGAGGAFGYMNILTADLSVKKAFIGWIYENGRDLGTSN
ncbi:MAG: hypothetical protein COA79_01290 [Planctomycetota bacterium]|nr:MAG: hypothetical protein COA79_01290 [Planctomycetota bacterium]